MSHQYKKRLTKSTENMDDTENVDRIADTEMHFSISFSLVLHEEIMTEIYYLEF